MSWHRRLCQISWLCHSGKKDSFRFIYQQVDMSKKKNTHFIPSQVLPLDVMTRAVQVWMVNACPICWFILDA